MDDIFSGLSSKQIGAIRHTRLYRRYPKGRTIFREGDEAKGLFILISGEVEIYRETTEGEKSLSKLVPQEVFGEIGLLSDVTIRSASVRTTEDSLIFEIPGNILDLSRQVFDRKSAIALHQNLIPILRERLARKDDPESKPMRSITAAASSHPEFPQSFQRLMVTARSDKSADYFGEMLRLGPGDYLCHEGDQAHGFYLVHEGKLDVLKDAAGDSPRMLAELEAPAIAGESGYFARERRTVSLRASDDVLYTYVSGKAFDRMKSEAPDEALGLLRAAAQFIAYLIQERENV